MPELSACKRGSSILRRGLWALVLAWLVPVAAQAQSQVCRQLESELASLERPVMRAGRTASTERAQLARVNSNIAAMNCNRGFVLFGPPLPPQCAGLKSQAAALLGRISQVESPQQVASGGDPRRRAQILAAIDSYNCRRQQVAAAPPQRERSFLEALFGRPGQPQYATPPGPEGNLPPLVDGKPVERLVDPNAKRVGGGGNLPICVRTCDGFFFPVNYEGTGANDQYDEMCQASCPASPTEVYWMPAGADLDRAANESGQNYTALPNAFKYRQAYDSSCSCKARDQTWAYALKQADALMGAHRTDITVTTETSDRMVRAEPIKGLRGIRDKKQAAASEEANGARIVTNSADGAKGGANAEGGRAGVLADIDAREPAGAENGRKSVRVVVPPRAIGQ